MIWLGYFWGSVSRGPSGQGAAWVFSKINENNKYYFDQACRVKAIETAAKLGLDKLLSINFLPNAVYNPDTCIRATIEAADMFSFDINKIMFEVTESEQIKDHIKLRKIFESYSKRGFITAIDDLGSDFAGLAWLEEIRPAVVKLDMSLIRNIEDNPSKRKALAKILVVCKELKSQVLAEGIETKSELEYLVAQGIDLFQGYYFAKPQLEKLLARSEISGWTL